MIESDCVVAALPLLAVGTVGVGRERASFFARFIRLTRKVVEASRFGQGMQRPPLQRQDRQAAMTTASVFPSQLRKQDHVANARGVGEQHHEAIDADPFARRWRQSELQRSDVIGVVMHGLFVARFFRFRLI